MTTTMNRLDELKSIAAKIRMAVSPIMDADAERDSAKKDADNKAQAASTKREQVMGELAALSLAGAWTEADIKSAAQMACGTAVSNEALPKSIATYVGEARRAMHPSVRAIFPHLAALRSEVWASEKLMRKADRECKAPLMDACIREYHALNQMMGAVIDGTTFTTAADVTAWAEARDPALDPKKQVEAIEAMLVKLAAISVTFPDADLVAAIDGMRAITADTLKAARAELLGRDEARLAAHKLAPLPTTVVPMAQPSEQAAETAADVLTVDPLEAALDALAA